MSLTPPSTAEMRDELGVEAVGHQARERGLARRRAGPRRSWNAGARTGNATRRGWLPAPSRCDWPTTLVQGAGAQAGASASGDVVARRAGSGATDRCSEEKVDEFVGRRIAPDGEGVEGAVPAPGSRKRLRRRLREVPACRKTRSGKAISGGRAVAPGNRGLRMCQGRRRKMIWPGPGETAGWRAVNNIAGVTAKIGFPGKNFQTSSGGRHDRCLH